MRPKRYPYNKKTNTSTMDIVKAFDKACSAYRVKGQKRQEKAEQELEKAKQRLSSVEHDIDQYIRLRTGLSKDDWNTLNAIYEVRMDEKERQLTENLSMSESDIDKFRSDAQELLGISE